MTKVTITFLALIMLLNYYGQELLPREREREIRTSGRYYYGECSDANEAEAVKCAIRELIQKVSMELRRQSISSDAESIRNAVEPKAKTATLSSQTGIVRIFAWIEKDNATPEPAPAVALAPTPPAPTPASPSTTAPMQPSAISNPIVRELSSHLTFEQFRRAADNFRREGRLTYGANRASFFNPNNCFIAVFSSEKRLIALLDTGQGARRDLLSGNTIQNVEQHFAGNNLIWIQIRD